MWKFHYHHKTNFTWNSPCIYHSNTLEFSHKIDSKPRDFLTYFRFRSRKDFVGLALPGSCTDILFPSSMISDSKMKKIDEDFFTSRSFPAICLKWFQITPLNRKYKSATGHHGPSRVNWSDVQSCRWSKLDHHRSLERIFKRKDCIVLMVPRKKSKKTTSLDIIDG